MFTIEHHIDTGNKITQSQNDNPNEIQLQPEITDTFRMVHECMKCGRHPQTDRRSQQEECEDNLVPHWGMGVPYLNVLVECPLGQEE